MASQPTNGTGTPIFEKPRGHSQERKDTELSLVVGRLLRRPWIGGGSS